MMNKQIRRMIDEIFADMKMTADNLALRDEMMANAQARFEDSVRAGKTEEEAFAEVAASLGDVQSLLHDMNAEKAGEDKEDKEEKTEEKAAKAEADEAPDFEVRTEKTPDIGDVLGKAFGALGDVGKQIVPQAQKLVRQVDDLTGGMIGGIGKAVGKGLSDAQKAAIAKMADTLGAAKHGFNLDISRKDGSTAATRWYEGRVRGSEVVRDLETYYRTGSLPEQSELNRFRYSKKVDAEKHPQRRKTGEEQVSFETLRELPDMEITEVEENDLADKPVKEILDAGLASTQRIPGKNSGSVVNRYTGDTIVVTRAGLRHGLLNAAQIQKNAPYVGQIGPILENAVKVNELEARGKEVRSDLYLGAARMSDGSLMGVRFVVNMYEDGQKVLDADSMEPLRGSLYAHTGRQIKNGTESLKGREVSTNAVALYGSNISIEDFLGSVKEELGENLSANVKYAFGMDTETTAGFAVQRPDGGGL